MLKDRPIFVLCDDVYRTLVYTEDYHSFAEYQDMRDRLLIVNSFSKPYAMTGWRLGYCMADAPIRDRMPDFPPVQCGVRPLLCAAGLRGSAAVGHVRGGGDLPAAAGLRLQAAGGHGAAGAKPRAPSICSLTSGATVWTLCPSGEKMLKEGLVGLIPGIYFGTEGYMRLSYCYSDADLKGRPGSVRSGLSRRCKTPLCKSAIPPGW